MRDKLSLFLKNATNKKLLFALAVVCASAGFLFFFTNQAHAGLSSIIVNTAAQPFIWFFGWVVQFVVGVLGQILITLFYILIAVANYNQFLASTAVSTGWVVMRDLVNMFFVLVLLAIAIGTILQQQKYHYSQLLPKFIAAAILVNFSKTICGILIDFSQVVMMTFVGAISGAIGGNLAALLGIPNLLKMVNVFEGSSFSQHATTDSFTALGGFFLAMILLSIALIVVGVMVVMLVIRIVALWFLIILSPAAFFLMALPNDKGYSGKWWDQFVNNLLVGPVMAFFLWLSLTVVAGQAAGNDATQIAIATELGITFNGSSPLGVALGDSLGGTGIGTVGGLAGYILGICMLMGTLAAAQQLSSAGGGLAGAASGYIKDWGAGKKGPFNPMRYFREGIGGVMERREKRRKERVAERVETWDRGFGIVQNAPRALAKAGAKAALGTRAGRRAREWYQSENVQEGLDTAARVASFGLGGWGQRYRTRMGARRSQLEKEIAEREPRIGRERGQEAQAEREAADFLVRADAAEAAARNATNPADRAARLAEAQALSSAAQAARQAAIGYRQAAESLENEVQMRKGQLLMNTVRQQAFSLYGKGARLMGAGIAGALTGGIGAVGAGAVMAPTFWGEVGRSGEASQIAAEGAQASAVSEHAKKFADKDIDELKSMLSSGAYTNREKMGMLQAMVEKKEFDQADLPQATEQMAALGAKGATLKQFQGKVGEKYPLKNWGIDPATMQSLTRPQQIMEMQRRIKKLIDNKALKGENLTDAILNSEPDAAEALAHVISDPAQKENLTEMIKSMKGGKGDDAKAALSVAVARMAAAPQYRDVTTGEFTQDGQELLQVFFQAGGQMQELLSSLNAATGTFGNVNDQNAFNQIVADRNFNHHIPTSLPQNIFQPANYATPVLQALARNASQPMLKELRNHAEASTKETVKEHAVQAFRFFEDHNSEVLTVRQGQALVDSRDQAATTFTQRDADRTRLRNDAVSVRTANEARARGGDQIAMDEIRRAEQAAQDADRQYNEALQARDQTEAALRAALPRIVAAQAHRRATGGQDFATISDAVQRMAQHARVNLEYGTPIQHTAAPGGQPPPAGGAHP